MRVASALFLSLYLSIPTVQLAEYCVRRARQQFFDNKCISCEKKRDGERKNSVCAIKFDRANNARDLGTYLCRALVSDSTHSAYTNFSFLLRRLLRCFGVTDEAINKLKTAPHKHTDTCPCPQTRRIYGECARSRHLAYIFSEALLTRRIMYATNADFVQST